MSKWHLLLLAPVLSACSANEPLAKTSTTRAPLWTGLPAMSEVRMGVEAAALPGGRALFVGGESSAACASTAEIFDRVSGSWSSGGAMSVRRGQHTVTSLSDGRVLVVGGLDRCSFGASLSAVELFDPKTNKWSLAAALNAPRDGHTTTELADGTVLVVGGSGRASAEIFDVPANAWTPVGALSGPRHWHATTRLRDGKVLVAGGSGVSGALASAELYDPATRTWKTTGAMVTARFGARAVTLRDGQVLVAGGYAEGASLDYSTSELYDPATGKFSPGPSMRVSRSNFTLTPLATGQVLVVGGESTGAVEMLDAAHSAFLDFGFSISPRSQHAAVTLDDGSVVVAGGEVGGLGIATAERYTALIDGSVCKRNEECASFVCDPTTKKCGPAPEAGLPPADATPVVSASATSCRSGSECASGFCVDGVCCDRACTERCHSCVLPTAPGKCTPEPTGVDLRGECGAALACAGTCGPGAVCIGAGAGTLCARSTCTGPSTGFGPTYCAARGEPCKVEAAVRFECAPYGCDPVFGACRSSCATSLDCAGGAVCDPDKKVCLTATPAAEADSGCSHGHARGLWAWPFVLLGLHFVRRQRASA